MFVAKKKVESAQGVRIEWGRITLAPVDEMAPFRDGTGDDEEI
jgi:hypothetical protein